MDRFIVKDTVTEESVWGDVNLPFSSVKFDDYIKRCYNTYKTKKFT